MIKRNKHIICIIFSSIGVLFGMLVLCWNLYFSIRTPSSYNFNSEIGAEKNVLFISSYHDTFETFSFQEAGIKAAFKNKNVNLFIEYMDMKNFNTEENILIFYKLLKYKFSKGPLYDAVIVGDDAALHFVEKYQKELFSNIPVIFLGINDEKYAYSMAENPFITGSIENFYLESILMMMVKLNPGASNIVGIYDDTISGKGDQEQFYKLSSKFSNYKFKGINASFLSKKDFAEQLSSLGKDDLVILLGFFEDGDNNFYTITKASEFVSSYSSVPVYTKLVGSVGHGTIGGFVIDFYDAGNIAGKMVLDIFSGKKVSDIPVYNKVKAFWIFDFNLIKKFNLNVRLLPSDSVFINKNFSYWDNYRLVLIPFFIIICSAISLLLTIILSYVQTSSFSKALFHSRNEIAFIADHDFLTRLPNRQLATRILKKLIKSGKDFSLMLIDVDDFKSINDFFSHLCGDFVLKTIAARLNSLMKKGDFFASRFGGDEFLLAYTGGHLDNSSIYLESLRQLLNMPFEYNDKRLFVHMSVGVANSYEGADLDVLMANADVALYDAKANGKNKISFFSDEMQESILRNEKIAKLLENACKYDGFTVLYQPLIDAKSNKVSGYEALIRLSVMDVSPNMFLPIAEDRGLMVKIGRIVTEKVVKQIAQWKSDGMELHRVAINYSVGQLADTEYVRFLKKLLDDYEVSPNYIEIEITEKLFMKNRQYANNLFKELSDIGVKLSLDDFGTGYSSLSYLTYLPVETVKIDKSIIDVYLNDEKHSIFVKNIVNLIHSLNMKLTVEGVEEKWQFEKLKEFQCDSVQGYYFSKPVKAAEMNENSTDVVI